MVAKASAQGDASTPRIEQEGYDLTFWAAYVVGHHPYSLQMWLENLWTNLRVGDYAHDPPILDSLQAELPEMDDALDLLADKGQLMAGQLLPFQRAWEEARRRAEETLDRCYELVPEDGFVPGDVAWDELQQLQGGLLLPQGKLENWRRLGEGVGRCQLRLGAFPHLDEDYIPR
jgi:hypothetical protein